MMTVDHVNIINFVNNNHLSKNLLTLNVNKESNRKNKLEIIPYSLFISLIIGMVFAFPNLEVFAYMGGGIIILLITLIIIPYYASKVHSLGILGSPCKFGGHHYETTGYGVVCRRCGHEAIKYE